MFNRRNFAALFMLCAIVFAIQSVSYAKDIIVSDAHNGRVSYGGSGISENPPAIATLRELFAKVIESGDTVYIGENWGGSNGEKDFTGNEEVDESWDTVDWSARFIVTEPIEISKDVKIYASCPGTLGDHKIEVTPTTVADMSDDLTTFEGKGQSQIFIITNGAKVTIANLRIHGAYGAGDSSGCAVYVKEGSHAEITNCIIKDSARNNYSRGGAIYVNASTLKLQSSDIINNYSSYRGGGIALENGSYASITNCTITSNDSPGSRHGGGGIYILSSSADITDSVITKNITSLGDGGGICVVGSSTTGISRVMLTNCTISDNTCQYNGGGIDVDYASAAITNCTISGNTCTGVPYSDGSHHHGNGGGIYVYQPQESFTVTDCVITGNSAYCEGGGIDFNSSYSITPIAENCLIADNTAYNYGGGIHALSAPEINNCTITGNKVLGYTTTDGTNWYGYGGGVYVSTEVLMTNSTLTKNSAESGGGLYFIGGSSMLSNCSIVDNSARNGGIEIQRDGGSQIYRIPFINSLIFNTTSPDRTINNPDADTIYDRSRMLFFNCAVPEALTLPERSPSFDIVKIASWDNPVSSTETVNGITHTVYRIEDNPALKPIVGAGANRIIYSNEYYTNDVNYTSPEYDQLVKVRVSSPDIGAVEKSATVPVLSSDADIHVVVNTEITPLAITDTEPNKALTWTLSGDMPSDVVLSPDANGMMRTLTGTPAEWGDYEFNVIASNSAGSDDVKVNITVYTEPVLQEKAEMKAVKGSEFSQKVSADSGNHLAWKVSGDIPEGLTVASDDTSFTVNGTPASAGDYEFTITASNLAGSDDIRVSIIVYEMPLLPDSIITIDAVRDFSLTEQNVTAAAGNHLTWSLDGEIPAGLYVHSEDNSLTATIMGTPAKEGDYNFSIIAGNYAGSSSIEVNAVVYAAPELSMSEISLEAAEGRALNAREVSVNSGNHLVWAKKGGTFPDGLSFSGNDESFRINGTPDKGTAGSYDCTFTASNLAGSADLRVIVSVYAPPVLSGDSRVIMYEGEEASTTITATAGNNLTWIHEGTLPDGVSVSRTARALTISGTPSAGTMGSYNYNVKAENNAGYAEKAITINVFAKNFTVTSDDVSSETALSDFLAAFTNEQLAVIETLKLNKYFTDLSGLEKLTGLKKLDLTEAAALKEVDLSGNTTVKTLELAGNTSVKTLKLADSVIEHVDAEGCSELQSMDIAGNLSIKELNVSNTALTVLNAEDCANLEVLLCSSCNISELYLAGCTGLKTLDFSLNAIRKFDVRGFAEMEALYCEGQIITGQAMLKNFAFRDFMSFAKVSYVEAEPAHTFMASGIDPNGNLDDTNVKGITGFNAAGTEIDAEYDSENGIVKFSEVPCRITYSYMVSGDKSMDVTISGDTEPELSPTSSTINITEGVSIRILTINAVSGSNLTWTTSGDLPRGMTGKAADDAKSFSINGAPASGTAGTYVYTVTASNTLGSADAVVTINVSAASPSPTPTPEPEPEPTPEPESPDVPPAPESPDVPPAPTSPDVPAPESPDVPPAPESPDVPPAPVSPDVPAPESPDVPPAPESPDVPPAPESPDVPPTPTSPDVPAPESPDVPPEPAPESPDVPPVPESPDVPPSPTPVPTPEPEPEPEQVEPVAGKAEEPTVNVQERKIVDTIINALQAVIDFVTGTTDVLELPEGASGSVRSIDDMSSEDIASVPETQQVAVVLPIMRIEEPAVYVFGVKLDNLSVGALIFLHLMPESTANNAEFYASDVSTEAYTFLDDEGNEITRVPASKNVNVAAYMEAGMTYAPVITTSAPSSGGDDNGSTDDNNGSENNNDSRTPGSSGGGCNSGMNLLASLIISGLLLKRRQR